MSFEEAVGNGNGQRVNAIKKIIADKRVELQPLADELTDLHQASVLLDAGEHFDSDAEKHLPNYIVIAGYNPRTKEYSLKFSHDYPGMMEYVMDAQGKVDFEKARAEDYSPGLAAMMANSYTRIGGDAMVEGPKRVTDDIIRECSNDDIIPGENGHSSVQIRSTSLESLLNYANQHLLNEEHQIDVGKYASSSVATGGPGM